MDYIFIAVDVAKDTLVVYNGKNTYTYPNERKLKHFARFLRKRYQGKEKRLVIIYEPTGPYSAFLEEFCAWKKTQSRASKPKKGPLSFGGHRPEGQDRSLRRQGALCLPQAP